MPYRQTVLLWLLMSSLVAAAQSNRRIEDSLRQAIRLSQADTSRVKLWLQLGQLYADIPSNREIDMDSACAYAKKAENLSRSLRFVLGYNRSQLLAAQTFVFNIRPYSIGALLRNKQLRTNNNALRIISEQYLRGDAEIPAYLDSAQKYSYLALQISVASQDNMGQVEALITLGNVCGEMNNRAKALAHFGKAALLIKQVKSPLAQARLWYQLGDGYNRSRDEIPTKIACYQRAQVLYRQVGERDSEALALKEVADMHQSQGQFAQSLRELLEVLQMQKALHSRNLHYTYDLLGSVNTSIGNYDQALRQIVSSIESAQVTADTTYLAFFYYRLAHLHIALGQRQKAFKLFHLVITRAQRNKIGEELTSSSTKGIIELLVEFNRPKEALTLLHQFIKQHPPKTSSTQFTTFLILGEIYAKLKVYTKAEASFLSALQLVRQSKFPLGNDKLDLFIVVDANLSKLYTETGQYSRASTLLGQALRLAQQRAFIKRSRDLQLQAFQLDSLQGNWASALAHYQHYKALNDSIFSEHKSNQLISYQVQYETQQKEQALKLQEKSIALLTQRSLLQQASLGQQRTQQQALVIGTILLLALLGLGYNRYGIKQRSNQKLLVQRQVLQLRQEEIDSKNLALEVLLIEKEWMLKEIHHRVKNNLQIITSLLHSQGMYLKDRAAQSAIRETQNRVHVMALIHQKLYQADRLNVIPMAEYIPEIVSYLIQSFDQEDRIEKQLVIAPVELDITIAVPLGLIINEVITNSLKYGFSADRRGVIRVELTKLEHQRYRLTVSDDGIGLPADFNPEKSQTLGMSLMWGLSKQIGGELQINEDEGVQISLTFTELKALKQNLFDP